MIRSDSTLARYRLTAEQAQLLYDLAGGACEMCKRPLDPDSGAIDHCHATDVVRGFLCIRCNAALGSFDDDPSMLRKAASYLEERRAGHPVVRQYAKQARENPVMERLRRGPVYYSILTRAERSGLRRLEKSGTVVRADDGRYVLAA